jgi:carbamoyl-phosphate synthase large subunit
MPILNVLVTAASRRVPLVRGFRAALASAGVTGRVVATDVNPWSPAVHVADAAYRVPLSTSPGYLDEIRQVCQREAIGLVVPTIDDELPVFAAAADAFARDGIRVAVSPYETTLICNDKAATCQHLRRHGVAAAESFLPKELPAAPRFPLFIKPRTGRGSVGAFPVRNRRELDFFSAYVPDPVVQEYLEGPEFTLDVFCTFSGEPLAVVPRERVVIRAGVIDRGRTVRDPALLELGVACARALRFAGPVNVQCRVTRRGPTVFEINPRFSGGIPLTIAAGADFPRWLIELALGRPVGAVMGAFTDNLWMTSFEDAFFLPEAASAVLQDARAAALPVP